MKTETMETVVRNHLHNTLELFNWNKTLAGRALDLDRRTVYRMIQRFKLEPRALEGPILKCPCGYHGPVGYDDDAPRITCPQCGADGDEQAEAVS